MIGEGRYAGLRKTTFAFGYLAAATIAGQVIAFGALAIVARRTGAAQLGAYGVDLTLATYIAIAGNFGVTYLATRDVAQRPDDRYRLLCDATALVIIVLAPLALLTVVLGHMWLSSATERVILAAVVLSAAITALTPDWYLLARQRSKVVGATRLAGQVVYGLLIVFLLGHGAGVIARYAWFNAAGFAATGVLIASTIASAWRRDRAGVRSTVAGLLSRLAPRLRRGLPFGYSLIVLQLYGGAAIPILGITAGTRQAGIYLVASRLPAAVIALANVWLAVFFPYGSAVAQRSGDALRSEVGRILSVTIVMSVVLGCAAPFAARELMPLMFGRGFAPAEAPFALLTIAAALVLLQATTFNVLLAVGAERLYSKLITVVAAMLIIADVPLCARFGATGAAAARTGNRDFGGYACRRFGAAGAWWIGHRLCNSRLGVAPRGRDARRRHRLGADACVRARCVRAGRMWRCVRGIVRNQSPNVREPSWT